MGMGIVSDKDFAKELGNTSRRETVPTTISPNPIAQVIDIVKPGRKEGDVNVPNSLREVIGETSVINGRQEAIELAKHFDISPSAVSAYAHGATSTASYDKTPNTSVIGKSKTRVQKRAINRLMSALAEITPDKLANSKARDLAGIAKDMSAIVKTMEPESETADKAAQLPQFLVYAPQFRDERSFEVIYAKE